LIFHIFTLFPGVFQGYLEGSILGKAIKKRVIDIRLINIRDFAFDKHKTCDDAPYGGGPGMLLKPEPVAGALDTLQRTSSTRILFLSPSGKPFKQSYAEGLAREEEVTLVCGHYEGFDQRVIEHFQAEEISVGDFVLSSGEVGAMVVIDCVSRLVSGVIKQDSVAEESFKNGLLEYPQYTRPAVFRNMRVPDVLLSGHHQKIEEWRRQKSLERTLRLRPDLLEKAELSQKDLAWLQAMREEGLSYGSDKNH
jgi:tRNA (guanine37-N1)-methyltransferase